MKFRYEHRSDPLLPRHLFVRRVMWHVLVGACIVLASLGVGVIGYRVTEKLSWLDSLLNASMILSGMGQVSPLDTDAGKLFASFYSLFAGMIFLVTAGFLIAPLAHRLLHRLHLEAEARSRTE